MESSYPSVAGTRVACLLAHATSIPAYFPTPTAWRERDCQIRGRLGEISSRTRLAAPVTALSILRASSSSHGLRQLREEAEQDCSTGQVEGRGAKHAFEREGARGAEQAPREPRQVQAVREAAEVPDVQEVASSGRALLHGLRVCQGLLSDVWQDHQRHEVAQERGRVSATMHAESAPSPSRARLGIDDLPDEVLARVAVFASAPADVASLAGTCQRLRRVVLSSGHLSNRLWQCLYLLSFGITESLDTSVGPRVDADPLYGITGWLSEARAGAVAKAQPSSADGAGAAKARGGSEALPVQDGASAVKAKGGEAAGALCTLGGGTSERIASEGTADVSGVAAGEPGERGEDLRYAPGAHWLALFQTEHRRRARERELTRARRQMRAEGEVAVARAAIESVRARQGQLRQRRRAVLEAVKGLKRAHYAREAMQTGWTLSQVFVHLHSVARNVPSGPASVEQRIVELERELDAIEAEERGVAPALAAAQRRLERAHAEWRRLQERHSSMQDQLGLQGEPIAEHPTPELPGSSGAGAMGASCSDGGCGRVTGDVARAASLSASLAAEGRQSRGGVSGGGAEGVGAMALRAARQRMMAPGC